jgi:hypothetical protein
MMQKSESIGALASALAKAQGEFGPVPFNTTNRFLGNRYADLGAVIQTAKPIIAANGLSVAQATEDSMDDYIGVNTILMHSSGEWISAYVSLPLGEEKGKSRAQVAGSIVSYLRRYAYASILGLYAEEETDGNDKPEDTKANARERALPPAEAPPKPMEKTKGWPAGSPPNEPTAMVQWFKAQAASMEPLKWTDEKLQAEAQALAVTLKKHGLTNDMRVAAYGALTGQASGKDMDPRQIIVLSEHFESEAGVALLVRVASHSMATNLRTGEEAG